MAKKKDKYPWSDNINCAPLIESHSRIKHSIIKDYLCSYLKVLASPRVSNLNFSIVDGFCGGGLYRTKDNKAYYGSPIIILQALKDTVSEILAHRAANNITRELSIKCTVYFIDDDKNAIEVLKKVSAPFMILDTSIPLEIDVKFIPQEFIKVYKDVASEVGNKKSIFIIDPYGYSEAPLPVIKEIMSGGNKNRETIWTFMVDALLTYANDESKALVNAGYEDLLALFSKDEKPTAFNVQTELFKTIKNNVGTPFFTPFAVKHKLGWYYWLIHMAWHYRASEVMKEVEHRHADQREHYGRAGLNMMAAEGQSVYLFGKDDIEEGRKQLREDIPELLSNSVYREGINFSDFMKRTYNETPLKSCTIKETLIEHPDIEVLTKAGGSRSSINGIKIDDTIKLKRQTRLIF